MKDVTDWPFYLMSCTWKTFKCTIYHFCFKPHRSSNSYTANLVYIIFLPNLFLVLKLMSGVFCLYYSQFFLFLDTFFLVSLSSEHAHYDCAVGFFFVLKMLGRFQTLRVVVHFFIFKFNLFNLRINALWQFFHNCINSSQVLKKGNGNKMLWRTSCAWNNKINSANQNLWR